VSVIRVVVIAAMLIAVAAGIDAMNGGDVSWPGTVAVLTIAITAAICGKTIDALHRRKDQHPDT
jgi:hypothetical protein